MNATALAIVDGEQENPAVMLERLQGAASGIIGRLEILAREAVVAKDPIEKRWLEDLRAYHGRYDEKTEKELENNPGSRAYVNITRTKTNRLEAKLGDLLFPTDDKNWGISATPDPELTENAMAAFKATLAKVAQANEMMQQPNVDGPRVAALLNDAHETAEPQRFATQKIEEANKRAEGMSRVMDDQLVECNYPKRSRDTIQDACRLGSGVMKGPMVTTRKTAKWETKTNPIDGTSITVMKPMGEQTPEFMRVDPWSFFPDPNATSKEDCEYAFERHLPSRRQLKRNAKAWGYYPNAVAKLIDAGPGHGTNSSLQHLTDLRALNGENQAITGRYLVWEYHGPLEVQEIAMLMRASGQFDEADEYEKDSDPLDDRMVILHFCDGLLLKLGEHYVLDSGELMYDVFSIDKNEASILGGVGIPYIMRPSQRVVNGAWRMALDNGGASALPQFLIDKQVVQPENGRWEFEPGKVWLYDSARVTGAVPFQVFNIPSNLEQLALIINLAMQFADDETAMPRIEGGDPNSATMVTQTAQGMSMLFNASNINFRRVVKNWDDDITTNAIKRLYDWNMQFHEDESIKGDMQIEARGTSALLVREMQSQNLLGLLDRWTDHPTLGGPFKPYNAQREVLMSLSVNPDNVLMTPEEWEQEQAKRQQAQQDQPPSEAEIKLEVANIESETRKYVADTNRETAMVQASANADVSYSRIAADIQKARDMLSSKERSQAAEFAGQRVLAREAKQLGQEAPAGGGGNY